MSSAAQLSLLSGCYFAHGEVGKSACREDHQSHQSVGRADDLEFQAELVLGSDAISQQEPHSSPCASLNHVVRRTPDNKSHVMKSVIGARAAALKVALRNRYACKIL